ncbi:polysaccharide deacetylase family protein [Fulvivirga sediminis]|uniref:Polysaccharide deacetylase family protein n=1 Tax=Fulvivirga sediminis TaxID=2803949 RepID=A0A937F7R5_9BACT|nr:polysaccharide deacetylase family protein [Fulvivirga sediminis]MBL3655633.1 polysaccharide deacetylase family protein [Fulvivirga sediminis]
MFLHKTPLALKWIYPQLTWSVPSKEKVLYLTFDDGPIPILTEFVIDTLDQFNAKATFFCVGDNIRKHPEIAQKTLEAGHTLGNHTYNHLNGWENDSEVYIENVQKCQEQLKTMNVDSHLLRPPYGRIARKQISKLKSVYNIIMWDVLTGDFSKNIAPEDCLKNSIRSTRKGSIVLFHDNIKAENNMKYALPRYLEHFSKEGYLFKAL